MILTEISFWLKIILTEKFLPLNIYSLKCIWTDILSLAKNYIARDTLLSLKLYWQKYIFGLKWHWQRGLSSVLKGSKKEPFLKACSTRPCPALPNLAFPCLALPGPAWPCPVLPNPVTTASYNNKLIMVFFLVLLWRRKEKKNQFLFSQSVSKKNSKFRMLILNSNFKGYNFHQKKCSCFFYPQIGKY